MKTPEPRYLRPTRFIDSDAPAVVDYTRSVAGDLQNQRDKAVALYYAVRDDIRYNPYCITFDPETYTAAHAIEQRVGFCIQKAVAMAAVARAAGIPSRVGFADVRNHLASRRLLDLMRTDVFLFHGYTEVYLNGCWVKCTPAFNLSLCERFGVKPLEFDGEHDSIFHAFDRSGRRHMEYLRDHGAFADLPFDAIVRAFREGYPHLFEAGGNGWPAGNIEQEAIADQGNG